ELRRMIWPDALSARAVWARRSQGTESDDLSASRPLTTMGDVGPAPYIAGLSCRKPRPLMIALYTKPLRVPGRPPTSAAVHWIDMKATTVFLGDFPSAVEL
ncbi:hypothetical protein LY78DRAFT_584887, partial [Colletotrichum sublineola]